MIDLYYWPMPNGWKVSNAPDGNDYAHQRYLNEYNRCLGVLERRLEGRDEDR